MQAFVMIYCDFYGFFNDILIFLLPLLKIYYLYGTTSS